MKNIHKSIILGGLVLLSQSATAEVMVGISANYDKSEYRVKDDTLVLPFFAYEGERFYAFGADAGVYVVNNETQKLAIGANYGGNEFDPKDADTPALKGLDKRKGTAHAYVNYQYATPYGDIEVEVANDVLGRHKGQTAKLAYHSGLGFADEKLSIHPVVGVAWYSQKYNQYYYGVSQDEQNRTGVSAHQAKSGVSPYVSLLATYRLSDKWYAIANGDVEWLSSTQKSEMTDKNKSLSFGAGLAYSF